MHENNTSKVTNIGTLTYEARQNTDFSLHGCVDQAENTLENLQTKIARDNVRTTCIPHGIWFKRNKLQHRGRRCDNEYTGIYILFRILATFHSINQPHNTTLSHVHTSGLRSRTHPAVSKRICLSALIASNVLPQLLLLAPLGKVLTCHTSFNQQYLERNWIFICT